MDEGVWERGHREAFGQDSWTRAVRVAGVLVEDAARRWPGEALVLPDEERSRWWGSHDIVCELVGLALWQCARTGGVLVDDVTRCAAARWLRTPCRSRLLEYPHPPVSDVLVMDHLHGPANCEAWSDLHRASQALDCTHAGGSCARVGDRREQADATSMQRAREHAWEVFEAYSATVRAIGPSGVTVAECRRCGAAGPWMFARPAQARRDWAWALCRCGHVADLEFFSRAHELPWTQMDNATFENLAATAGYGRLGPWTGVPVAGRWHDPVTLLGRTLPEISRGGDEHWRRATRAAADLLVERREHPGMPRWPDGGLDEGGLGAMAGLAALILYLLAEASGLPIERVDLGAVLRAGPDAVHARLTQDLPDAAAFELLWDRDAWRWRQRRWPHGDPHPELPPSDPTALAWASLADQVYDDTAACRLIPNPRAHRYRRVFDRLAALVLPPSAH
jgi:hypothetical protein